jgi:hypothetical protein
MLLMINYKCEHLNKILKHVEDFPSNVSWLYDSDKMPNLHVYTVATERL